MAAPQAKLPPVVIAALARGDQLSAIRALRDHYPLGLKEARAVIVGELNLDEALNRLGAPNEQLPDVVRAALDQGDVLKAIRKLREIRGLDLVAAKAAVEFAQVAPKPKRRGWARALLFGRMPWWLRWLLTALMLGVLLLVRYRTEIEDAWQRVQPWLRAVL